MLSKRLSTAATTIVVLLLTRSSAHAGIFINEFMASNTTTLQDQDGEFSDWIEIYNSGSAAVNLNGYFLTDTPSVPTAWKFPSTSVPSHGYLIVFASDKNRAVSGSELHTNFKLSASGEYLGLIAPNGTTVVDEYAPAFPAQSPDISYGLAPDLATERCFLHPTPGGPNDVSQACNLVDASSGLVITEFMASNATTLKDQDGEFSDWIEIFNSSASSRNLNGFFLTDDATNRTKWRFPSTVLPSGGYLVVFASSKNRAVSGAQLHTNFKLAAAGQYLALVNPDGVKVAHQYAPAYPPQTSDISWGLTNDRSRQRCFLHPTPGQANDESTPCGNVAPLSVVPGRGFYTKSFDVQLSTATSGATITYTLNGDQPTSNSTRYTGPIHVTSTAVLRAAAFAPDLNPTPSVSHTYIFTAAVIRQPASISGYPNKTYDVGNNHTAVHDNAMDQAIVNSSTYSGTIQQALVDIPSIAIAVPVSTMFGTTGFYDGEVEVPASIEVLYPTDPLHNEQANGGVEPHSHLRLKRSLRVSFKSQYGPSKLRTDLLRRAPLNADSAINDVDSLVLRGGNNRSWARDWNPSKTTYTEDQWYRDSQIAMSGIGSHGTFVHLYINGIYWGLYNAVERPDENFEAAYGGGSSSNWFSVNHDNRQAGNATRWNYLKGTLKSKNMTVAANYAELKQYLDVTEYADYLLLSWYAAVTDWPQNNFWGGNRNDVVTPHRYYAWDGEWSWDVGLNGTAVNGAWVNPAFRNGASDSSTLAQLWYSVKVNSDFMMLLADRAYRHTSGNGALTDVNARARFGALNAFIDKAIIAESARWGDALKALGQPTRTRNVDWLSEVNAIDGLMNGNAARLIAALRAQGYYPSLNPPTIANTKTQFTLSNPNSSGSIYFTTDRSDPRASGGGLGATAILYTGPRTYSGAVRVKARVLSGSNWSALADKAVGGTACDAASECNDQNPCTTDTCAATGVCQFTNNSASCNDGISCTTGDVCSGGACHGAPNNGLCDDGNTCTQDTCSATTGCKHTQTCGPPPIGIDGASVKTACVGTPGDSLVIANVSVGTFPNRILVVTVGAEEDDSDCNLASPQAAVKYGQLALTRAAAAVSDTTTWRTCNGVFYLLNPPAGTANVTINFPANGSNMIDNRQAGAFVLYNAAQQAPEALKTAGAEAATNPVKTTITTLSNEAVVVDVITQGNTGTFTATQPGQVERWKASCTSSASATSTAEVPAAGPMTMGWSHTNPKRYSHTLVAFAAAGASGCTSNADCNDADPCTQDACSAGSCSHSNTCSAMPVAIDDASVKSACNGAAGDTLVIPSVTVSAWPNRVLVVTAGAEEDDADCNLASSQASVTYGSLAMTRAAAAVSDTSSWRTCNGIFYLLDPPAGTANVTVNFPANGTNKIDNRHGGAFVLYNAAQRAPEATKTAGADATTNPVSTSISTLSDNAMVVDIITRGNVGTFTALEPGQIARWQASCTSSSSASSTGEVPAAGAVTLRWNHTSPNRYAHTLAVFGPAN